MFGRKKADSAGTGDANAPAAESPVAERTAEPAAGHPLRQSLRPEVPRPVAGIPGIQAAPAGMQQPKAKETAPMAAPDPKTLIVGRDISLTGDITACDKLVVEGRIEANMKDCRVVEIAESGLFKGEAEIGEADISGTFDGSLKVQGRLVIRATGSVKGEVEYGELMIEGGGCIQGTVKAPAAVAAPAAIAVKA